MHTKQTVQAFLKTTLCSLLLWSGSLHAQTESTGRFYIGGQLDSPLYWGDVFSTGDKIYPGIGGGLLAGYNLRPWLGLEVSADYMAGKMSAAKWQQDDEVLTSGQLSYINGDWKLGDIYTRPRSLRAGLRVPVYLLQLLRTKENRRFDIALVPHIYFNHFTNGIYDKATKDKLANGSIPTKWAAAYGGDLELNLRVANRSTLFFRSSLSWLSDERFDAVSTDPAWRVSLAAYATIGIKINLGRKRSTATITAQPQPVAPTPVEETAVAATPSPDVQDTILTAAVQDQQPGLLDQLRKENIPVIYFKRGSAIIDPIAYTTSLNELKLLVQQYPQVPVLIEGWCDATGTPAANTLLGQQRANALARYLIQSGVPAHRTISTGKGIWNGPDDQSRRAMLKWNMDDRQRGIKNVN